jgi:Asp-tRNA(Asn)/Glu-tRNA(Gln) amidotransferase A subunit family amidase
LPDEGVRRGDLDGGDDLAFADLATLAALVRNRQVSSVELTELYLERLRLVDEQLLCVVTLTDERALTQAEARDKELAEGTWRGPLHGIPWGAKDLLAVAGYRTTWGTEPFVDQKLAGDATVVERLDHAGAVLIAKLTLGELAMGDKWFGGMTRNPWAPDKGSSGSSAGSAAATAAGGVAFSIGSETLGSIVSPSTVCGCSSLRPTFGRVSRQGAMALSWSMDKLGPICRSVRDAALVFDAIHGPDGLDPTVHDFPFEVPGPVDVHGWRVGVVEQAFEEHAEHAHVLEELKALGVDLVPITLPDYPVTEMCIVLQAEAATAFDELTRSGRDRLMAAQEANSWPNQFRSSRLIPAVEYLRANRLRTELMRAMHDAIAGVDAYVYPSFGGTSLVLTNLTGHPTVVAPDGFRDDGTPRSISFTGHLFGESRLLALAAAWQESTEFHLHHPPNLRQ